MTADNGYFLYYNKEYFSDEDVKSLDTILQIAAENTRMLVIDMEKISGRMSENEEIAKDLKKETNIFKTL